MTGVLFHKRYLEIGDEKHVEMNSRINELVDRSEEPKKSGGE